MILKERVKHELYHRWLKIEQDWKEWVNDVHSLDVPIRAKFLDEQILVCQVTHQLRCSKSLSSRKGGDDNVVMTSSNARIVIDFVIESRGRSISSSEVGVEEGKLYPLTLPDLVRLAYSIGLTREVALPQRIQRNVACLAIKENGLLLGETQGEQSAHRRSDRT